MSSGHNLVLEDVYPGGRSPASTVLVAPSVSAHSRVFAEALLENSTTRQRRSPMDWAYHLSFISPF